MPDRTLRPCRPRRSGPYGRMPPAGSGHLPAGVAMWAGAIQARSSMAWSPGQLGDVGGPDDGAGSEQRDERGRGAVACAQWDIRGQAFAQR